MRWANRDTRYRQQRSALAEVNQSEILKYHPATRCNSSFETRQMRTQGWFLRPDNFRIYRILFKPRNASLHSLPTCSFTDKELLNNAPRFLTELTGSISEAPTWVQSMFIFNSFWRDPMTKNSVLLSLNNNWWLDISALLSARQDSVVLKASSWGAPDPGRKEGHVKPGVVGVSLHRWKILFYNI